MLDDMADAIAACGQTYTLRRANGSTYSGGRAITPTWTDSTITAVIHPLNGREVERLPEAMRGKEVLRIFSSSELQSVDSGPPDNVLVSAPDGAVETWEVQSAERWNTLGNYYAGLIMKVGR